MTTTTPPVDYRSFSGHPGSAPKELVVAPGGVRPEGCDVCTWGYQKGQLVLKFIHSNCPVHRDLPRK